MQNASYDTHNYAIVVARYSVVHCLQAVSAAFKLTASQIVTKLRHFACQATPCASEGVATNGSLLAPGWQFSKLPEETKAQAMLLLKAAACKFQSFDQVIYVLENMISTSLLSSSGL